MQNDFIIFKDDLKTDIINLAQINHIRIGYSLDGKPCFELCKIDMRENAPETYAIIDKYFINSQLLCDENEHIFLKNLLFKITFCANSKTIIDFSNRKEMDALFE